jgi:hypothetical protein
VLKRHLKRKKRDNKMKERQERRKKKKERSGITAFEMFSGGLKGILFWFQFKPKCGAGTAHWALPARDVVSYREP